MTTLSVNDLPESKELDGNTMAGVVGALYPNPYPGYCNPCYYPRFYHEQEYSYNGYTGFHMTLDYTNEENWWSREVVMING